MRWLAGAVVGIALLLSHFLGDVQEFFQHSSSSGLSAGTSSQVASSSESLQAIVTSTGGFSFGKNSSSVYCNAGTGFVDLTGSDPRTFQIVEYLNHTGDSLGTSLLLEKDNNHVYLGCSEVSAADARTFKPLYNSHGVFTGYLSDKTGIYFATDNGLYNAGTITPVPFTTDRIHFAVLNGWESDASFRWSPGDPMPIGGFPGPHYARDSEHVYVDDSVLLGADPNSFTIVAGGDFGESFGKDDHHVFIEAYTIPGLDPRTFEPVGSAFYLGGGYVKDAYGVYYLFLDENDNWTSNLIKDADPSTFVSVRADLAGFDAKDKNHLYLNGSALR